MAYSEWKNAGSQVYYLGSGSSIDISTLFPNDYASLTADNFIVQPKTISGKGNDTVGTNPSLYGPYLNTTNLNYSKSYNALTGVISASYGGGVSGGCYGQSGSSYSPIRWTHNISTTFDFYLVIGEIENV